MIPLCFVWLAKDEVLLEDLRPVGASLAAKIEILEGRESQPMV